MRLRNKKTGEIIDDVQYRNYSLPDGFALSMNGKEWKYHSLAELNEEWEDAPEETNSVDLHGITQEEPKEYWYIDYDGGVLCGETDESSAEKMMISIGNHFESLEEAEKAVEKLEAAKRLKDRGFRFDGWTVDDGLKISIRTNFEGDNIYSESEKEIRTNLDLLFGGEE